MSETVSSKKHRLKFKGRFIDITSHSDDSGLRNIEVYTRQGVLSESDSFTRATRVINQLLDQGIRSSASIRGVLDRTPMVDYQVLKLMKDFVERLKMDRVLE